MNSLAAAVAVGLLYASSAVAQTPSVTGSSEASLAGGTAINAELNSSIDSKKAKEGQQIVAHVTEAVKSADGRTILPNGTKLIGHVTQASARSNGEGEAVLAFQFDKATLKGGQEVQLGNAVVQAIAAPAHDTSSFGGSPGPGPTTSGGGGGTSTNNPSMSGSRGARPDNTPSTQPSYPGGNNGASAGESNSGGPLAAGMRGVYGMEGLRLTSSERGTVLTSNGKNVHLDGGTRVLLTVQPQSATSTPSGH
jgi:hypothetical protein